MKKLPTDLQVLNKIYEQYYEQFTAYSTESKERDSKIYVPIDIELIARQLKVDQDIVFGRLYYHLNKKHGYKNDNGSYVHLFTLVAGNDRHCVNFPLVASVLADLRQENKKYRVATTLAIISLIISIIALVLTLFIK